MLQRQFYFFGTYFLEEDLLRCRETAAKGAEFILDVGANTTNLESGDTGKTA